MYGIGVGLAAAAMIGQRPTRVERIPANEDWDSFERRYFSSSGLRVTVLKFAKGDHVLPESVEIKSVAALRQINHDFPSLTRNDLIDFFWPPKKQTENSI